MTIEVLRQEDLPAYKELIDSCFGESNDLEAYKKYAQNGAYQILVAKSGSEGTIVGSVTRYSVELFTFGFQPCLMLFNVAVSPSCRKQGIGRQMMEQVIGDAKEEGYRSISLTCLDNAVPAHKLYESVGFVRMGSVKYQLDL
ncbi:MAG: GNAT family N-acetyltransferase [Oscillospiraceae bacterium]